MTRALATALAAAILVAPLACDISADCGDVRCGACPPALSVRVVDASSGAVLADASVGGAGSCSEGTCSLDGGARTYEFDVSAPGHETKHVRETVPVLETDGCCSCGFAPRTIDVALDPS